MNYYKRSNILRDENGVRFLSLRESLPIFIPESDNDIFVETTDSDRLDLLAEQYYGDARFWRIVAMANPGTGNGTLFLEPGKQLRIPQNIGDILDLFS